MVWLAKQYQDGLPVVYHATEHIQETDRNKPEDHVNVSRPSCCNDLHAMYYACYTGKGSLADLATCKVGHDTE